MKTFTTFGLLTALLSGRRAISSALVVHSATSENIVIRLDHGEFTLPGHSVEFTGVASGSHLLKVYKLVHRSPAQGTRLLRHPSRKEIYSGSVYIPEGTEVHAEIDRRQLFLTCIELPVNAACRQPAAMTDGMFQRLLRSVESKTFESSKLSTARLAASGNYFTSCQVTELLGLFTFESAKLEFAKLVYARTVDTRNYFQVFDAFTFESSIDELQLYTETWSPNRLTSMHNL